MRRQHGGLRRGVAQPGRQQQVVELLQPVQARALQRHEDEHFGVARRVAQPLVDGLLPEAPEGVGIGIALAGLTGGKFAGFRPQRRVGLGDQCQRVKPGRGLGKQLLALADQRGPLFQRQLKGQGAGAVPAFGDVGRRAQRLGHRIVQPQQHAARLVALAGQHQPLGQEQPRHILQSLGPGLGLLQQPVPQRPGVHLAIAAQAADQAHQQPVAQIGLDALPQRPIERPQKGHGQQARLRGRRNSAQLAQPVKKRQRAAGMHDHAQRADQRVLGVQLQVPGVVKAHQPAPGRPPQCPLRRVAHQHRKARPGQRRVHPPRALAAGDGQPGLVQLGQQLAQRSGVEAAAACRAVRDQQLSKPADGGRRLHKAQPIEHGLQIGRQLADEVGGRGHGGRGVRQRVGSQCKSRD